MTEPTVPFVPAVKKDPRGLIQADLARLKEAFPPPSVKPGASWDQLLFAAGTQEVIRYIEERMVSKWTGT